MLCFTFLLSFGLKNYVQVTHAPIVPPLVLFLAKHPLVDSFDLSSLVEVTSGAAPLGKEMEDAMRKRLPNIIMKQGTK